MRNRLLVATSLLVLALPAISANASTPAHFWSQRFGGTSGDRADAVAVDAAGNVIVTGSIQGTVNLGGGDLTPIGSTDIFLAKYSATGSHIWSKLLGGTGQDEGNAIAIDGGGNILLTGYFSGSANFGGGLLTSAGARDILVAKFDASGNHVWSKQFGGTTDDEGFGIAVDPPGNVFFTGIFFGTVNFGGGNLNSLTSFDGFIVKFDAGGNHAWSNSFGGTSASDNGSAVVTDQLGNVVLAGATSAAINFGGGPVGPGGVLVKYDGSGAHVWSKTLAATAFPNAVARDSSGNVIATGFFSGAVNFGGGNLISAGGTDVFIVKFDTNGLHVWSRGAGGTGGDFGTAVATDLDGNAVVTGNFDGTADFGGGNRTSNGSVDIFVAKYTASGSHVWSGSFGGVAVDNALSVAVEAVTKRPVVSARFSGTINVGGGDLVSAGSFDILLAKFSRDQREPQIAGIPDVPNDQGGVVRVVFGRSGFDYADQTLSPITNYGVWRRVDDFAAVSSSVSASDDIAAAGPGVIVNSTGLATTGLPPGIWEWMAGIPALQQELYVAPLPTLGDSTSTETHYTTFVVTAHTLAPAIWYAGEPDSGYSIDNLAPSAPTNLAYLAGVLSWDESPATDFDYFAVYGGNSSTFGSATIIDYTVTTSLNISTSPYSHHFVTTTDFAGNESQPAVLATSTGIPGGLPTFTLSVSNYPNPFNPGTTVKYTVPSRGDVTIAVYDVRGTRVATLVNHQVRTPGAYAIEWNGRADTGAAVSSGVYFARIEHDGSARSKKMVMLK